MPRRHIALPLFLLLACHVLAADAPGAGAAPGLRFAPCRLEHPLGVLAVEAECGRLAVPENRALPDGRQLQLFVARLPALSRRSRPEPLFLIAGGPGLGTSTFYTTVAPAFARIRRTRDIIIVDQRGTGRSHPLHCPAAEEQLWDAGEAETARLMRACLDRLSASQDPAQYTTSVAVRDLDVVRAALGYQRIALYGGSYGTRVAQHYARRYPQHVLALVLDGVVPPTQILGPTTPHDAEDALRQIFARCRADAACAARFGDPEEDYLELRSKLAAAPVDVQMPDPRSGEPRHLVFTGSVFAAALRLISYTADQAALLPLVLHLANDQDRFAPLAAQYLLAAAGYDALLAYGMHNSVVCAEDVPFFDPASIDRSALGETFLGTSQLDALGALCGEWPRGPVDADLHAPLASTLPALLLSGGADPVTPPSFGAAASLGFARALHLTLPGQGHGQLLQPCMDRVMAQFLDDADGEGVPAVSTACVMRNQPAPFFLSPNGPAP